MYDRSVARMKILVDTERKVLSLDDREMPLYGQEAFHLLSDLWLKTSWNQKYPYTFTWMGRPIIQHPEDLIRLQEIIFSLLPDVIIETGVAHGGSLIFYASLFKAVGKAGRVIGVDIEIRPNNRKAIESHPLSSYITLVEGDSVAPQIVASATAGIRPSDVVLIILDSNHTKQHVAKELQAYHRFVSKGSYIVATDGVMQFVHDTPRGKPEWRSDNPSQAAIEFAENQRQFVIEEPKWLFNESELDRGVTAWPSAWLKRVG